MAADHFCLRWNNYQNNMVTELDSLRSDEDLVDVTLSCEGQLLKAHKVILSACSSYFRNVFKDNPCKHPVVILKDVSYEDVEALLSFIYQGVVYISEKKLASFLQTAELLQIRGLTGAATTMKETSFNDSQGDVNKANDKTCAPPPLLTANLINSWKQQGLLNTTSSLKHPNSLLPSSSILPVKRKKIQPNRLPVKENLDYSDTNSNQDRFEDNESPSVVKSENIDSVERVEDDYNSMDEVSRGESSRDENPSMYDNLESDETEEEMSDMKSTSLSEKQSSNTSQTPDTGNTNAACSSVHGVSNYASSHSSSEQNSPASDARLGRRPCPLCRKIISNKSNLLKHMRIRHSDEYNPAGCTMCGKVFKNKYSLRAHINIYHKESPPMGVGGCNFSTVNATVSVQAAAATAAAVQTTDYVPYNTSHHGSSKVQGPHTASVAPLYSSSSSLTDSNNFILSALANDSHRHSCSPSSMAGGRHQRSVAAHFNISNAPLT